MEFKTAIDMIKKIKNIDYESVNFVEDFVNLKKKYFFLSKDILFITNENNWTVAHAMAQRGFYFDPDRYRDILLLADEDGETVAHYMAWNRYRFNPDKHKDIILLANKYSWTVAHEMALRGYKFDPKKHIDILLLEDKKGRTVAEVQGLSKKDVEQLKQKYQTKQDYHIGL